MSFDVSKLSQAAYDEMLYLQIRAAETLKHKTLPFDNGELKCIYDSDGRATIGVGFNIGKGADLKVQEDVIKKIFYPKTADLRSQVFLDGDNKYKEKIISVLSVSEFVIKKDDKGNDYKEYQYYPKDNDLSATLNISPTLLASKTNLLVRLDAIMALREADKDVVTDIKRKEFRFANETEVKLVYTTELPTYEGKVDKWTKAHLLFAAPDYKMPLSYERAALVSLAWNQTDSKPLLGDNLAQAITDSDRARAWYEIRYRSNGDKLEGQASRRGAEAELFGLYGRNTDGSWIVNEAIARQIGKLNTDFENNTPKGEGGLTIRQYDKKYNAAFKDAGKKYETHVPLRLSEAAQPAIDFMTRVYDRTHAFGTRPGPFQLLLAVPTAGTQSNGVQAIANVLDHSTSDYEVSQFNYDLLLGSKTESNRLTDNLGNDLLIGGDQADELSGGIGRDTLISGLGINLLNGGDGDDTLLSEGSSDVADGGNGFDRYVRALSNTGASTGQLRVRDSDGQGVVVFRASAVETSLEGDALPILNAQGNLQYYLLYSGPYVISGVVRRSGSTLELFYPRSVVPDLSGPADIIIEGWSEQNNYGIHLLASGGDCRYAPDPNCYQVIHGSTGGTDFGDLGEGQDLLYADGGDSAVQRQLYL